jgi:hypothetical protein
VQILNREVKFNFEKENLMQVKILDDTKVEARDSNGVIAGNWNIYFEQALVVELDNGLRYFADLRYNIKEPMLTQQEVIQNLRVNKMFSPSLQHSNFEP